MISRSKDVQQQKQSSRPSRHSHYIEYTKADTKADTSEASRPNKVHKVEVVPARQGVQLGLKIQKRRQRERHFTQDTVTETSCAPQTETRPREHRSPSASSRRSGIPRRLEQVQKSTPSPKPAAAPTPKPDEASSEEDATLNNNIVKMLKKIDKQGLKKRLSLDKLDSLDTDDEVC